MNKDKSTTANAEVKKRIFEKRRALPTGTEAPKFRLPKLEGDGFTQLDDYQGKRLVVFVKPGCPGCDDFLKVVPELYRDHPDVRIFLVSHGLPETNREKFKSLLPVRIEIGLEPRDLPVLRDYGATAYPSGYLIDEQGAIAASAVGAKSICALVRPVNRARRDFLKSAAAVAAAVAGMGWHSEASPEICRCVNNQSWQFDPSIHCCTDAGVTYRTPRNPWGGIDLNACPFGQRINDPFLSSGNGTGTCGADGGYVQAPYYFWGFVPIGGCCGWHDDCYGDCQARQEWCDDSIGPCIEQTCRAHIEPLAADLFFVDYFQQALIDCINVGYAYQWAVQNYGKAAYDTSQSTRCLCCEQQPCANLEEAPPIRHDPRCPAQPGYHCGISPQYSCAGIPWFEPEWDFERYCYCNTNVDGWSGCLQNVSCGRGLTPPCNTQADCPRNFRCINSCCGRVCIPQCG